MGRRPAYLPSYFAQSIILCEIDPGNQAVCRFYSMIRIDFRAGPMPLARGVGPIPADQGIRIVMVCSLPSLTRMTFIFRMLSGAALLMIQVRCWSCSVT